MFPNLEVEVLVPSFCQLGEGPHWSEAEQCLYYVDIVGKRVCRYDPEEKENKFVQVSKPPFGDTFFPFPSTFHRQSSCPVVFSFLH